MRGRGDEEKEGARRRDLSLARCCLLIDRAPATTAGLFIVVADRAGQRQAKLLNSMRDDQFSWRDRKDSSRRRAAARSLGGALPQERLRRQRRSSRAGVDSCKIQFQSSSSSSSSFFHSPCGPRPAPGRASFPWAAPVEWEEVG